MSLLERINSPEDLKDLDLKEMEQLAQEIRELLIDVTSKHGGHVAPNLGVVELTIALHHIFDSPKDKIIWDVGHQVYPHKILTGRRDRMYTLRQLNGISGFSKPSESPHDPFGAGHASTSISAGLGFVKARDMAQEDYYVIAVIGDGALTGGMAMEALNYGGHIKPRKFVVILNDNERSIAENVGGFSNYLAKLSSNKLYNKMKSDVRELIASIPDTPLSRKAKTVGWKIKESLKNLMIPTVIFEELGYRYIGPVNGHDLNQLIDVLAHVQKFMTDEPVVVHVITKKGKGYKPAEERTELFHGLGPYDKETGEPIKKPGPPKYSRVYGNALIRLAEENPKVVAITAAMPLGTGLDGFRERFPDRLFDVGIAEQHATTFCAAMAMGGLIPFCTIYSTFMQRALDQVIHDVALHKAPVRFAMDRAGLVGDDGPTHHGVFDLVFMRMVPGMVVSAPKDEDELTDLVFTMAQHDSGPFSVRYPRGSAVGVEVKPEPEIIPVGKWETLKTGKDLAILAVGSMVHPSLEAAKLLRDQGVDAAVINARFVKPLDHELLLELAESGVKHWITVEEGTLMGGFGSGVLEFIEENHLHDIEVRRHGIPDRFIPQGTRAQCLEMVGLYPEGIANFILEKAWPSKAVPGVDSKRQRF